MLITRGSNRTLTSNTTGEWGNDTGILSNAGPSGRIGRCDAARQVTAQAYTLKVGVVPTPSPSLQTHAG